MGRPIVEDCIRKGCFEYPHKNPETEFVVDTILCVELIGLAIIDYLLLIPAPGYTSLEIHLIIPLLPHFPINYKLGQADSFSLCGPTSAGEKRR